jgi:hypothetical protein
MGDYRHSFSFYFQVALPGIIAGVLGVLMLSLCVAQYNHNTAAENACAAKGGVILRAGGRLVCAKIEVLR